MSACDDRVADQACAIAPELRRAAREMRTATGSAIALATSGLALSIADWLVPE